MKGGKKVKEEFDSDSSGNYEFCSDSDFEHGLPLKELMIQGRSNDSVMSPVSSRTRLGLNKRTFVRCSAIPENFDLGNYEGDSLLKKKVRVNLVWVDDVNVKK